MIKFFIYIIILICINGFSTLQAEEANVQINEFNYTFSNGNQLRIIPGQGVKFRQKNLSSTSNELQETVISDYPSIEQFFETDQLSKSQWMGGLSNGSGKIGGAYIRHTNKGTTFQIFESGPNLYFVNQEGMSFIIPLPKKKYEHVESTINGINISLWNWSFLYFEANGHIHGIFSLQYEEAKGTGVSFVIRDDGRLHYIGEKCNLSPVINIDKNRLVIQGLTKSFDLLKLDNSNTPLRMPRKENQEELVLDESGKEKKTVSQIVHDNFQDFGKIVLNSPIVFDALDEEEIRAIRRSLNKKQTGSIFITGESGSGKTELMRAFVKGVKEGNYPEIPEWTEFIQIDAASLEAGAKFTGMLAARINALIKYASNNDVILVLDEAHTLRGSGTHEHNANDLYQILKPYLADGSIRIIGTTTDEDFDAAFSGDHSLARRFNRIAKKPISEEKIDIAMVKWSEKMDYQLLPPEIRHRIRVLSHDYDAVGLDIVKAIKLQDEFYSELSIDEKMPSLASMEDLENVAARLYGMDKAHFDPLKREELLLKFSNGLEEDIIGNTQLKKALINDGRIT